MDHAKEKYRRVEHYIRTGKHVKGLTNHEQRVVRSQAKRHIWNNATGELLFVGGRGKVRRRVVRDQGQMMDLLRLNHVRPEGGHSGINATLSKISSSYFWDGMKEDVKGYISACDQCKQLRKAKPQGLQDIPMEDVKPGKLAGPQLVAVSGSQLDIGRQYATTTSKRKIKEEIGEEDDLMKMMPEVTDVFVRIASDEKDNGENDGEGEAHSSTLIGVQEGDTTGNVIMVNKGEFSIEIENPPGNEDYSGSCDPGYAYSTDLGQWPLVVGEEMREYWVARGSEECQHNTSHKVQASLGTHEKKAIPRFCKASFFIHVHKRTKQQTTRNWLCYSPSVAALFCFPCKLFSETSVFGKQGFNDWKNAHLSLQQHERSKAHQDSLALLLVHKSKGKQVDPDLTRKAEAEHKYWSSVLERVAATIMFLAERGLTFYGTDETVGSPNNGNFLGALELIAEYDPFLAQHIHVHANKGKGHSSHLSKTTCDELIDLMGKCVLEKIFQQLKESKYYSVSVDSTPDLSHVDQLTCIFRYVLPSGPVERFVGFLNTEGHSGSQLAQSLLSFMTKHEICIKDCRGQSYDNTSNMSGKYKDMQTHLQKLNPLAEHMPCTAHSLSLVGQQAASCCRNAIKFFDFVERLYVFFSASTFRWNIFTAALPEESRTLLVTKGPTDTKWSTEASALKSLLTGYWQTQAALQNIADDKDQKVACRQEAHSLSSIFSRLETGIMTILWQNILERFEECGKSLQTAEQDLVTICALHESLINFVHDLSFKFEEVEEQAKMLTQCSEYREERQPARTRRPNKRQCSPGSAPETTQTATEKFRAGTFTLIIDSLKAALSTRLHTFRNVSKKFGFLRNLTTLPPQTVLQQAEQLVQHYPGDLEAAFPDELLQFSTFLNTDLGMTVYSQEKKVDDSDEPDEEVGEELRMFRFITEYSLQSSFPNVWIALRMSLCLMVSDCPGMRSSAKLQRIKNELQSIVSEDQLTMLTLLRIERELLRDIDIKSLISDYALQRSRESMM